MRVKIYCVDASNTKNRIYMYTMTDTEWKLFQDRMGMRHYATNLWHDRWDGMWSTQA